MGEVGGSTKVKCGGYSTVVLYRRPAEAEETLENAEQPKWWHFWWWG